jgi:glycosyltransferase involved in cell wall biosynthesis
MNCGCPIIVSNRGSLPEIAGQAGLVLDVLEEDVWTNALHSVLVDKQMQKMMIELGYAQAATFSWQKAAAQTLQIYRGS